MIGNARKATDKNSPGAPYIKAMSGYERLSQKVCQALEYPALGTIQCSKINSPIIGWRKSGVTLAGDFPPGMMATNINMCEIYVFAQASILIVRVEVVIHVTRRHAFNYNIRCPAIQML